MEITEYYFFLVSLIIGALIGTERQRRLLEEGRRGVAGLRTFTLTALLGTLCALMADRYGPLFVIVAFAAFSILVGAAFSISARNLGTLDFTSAVAAVITFILGALCFFQDQILLAVGLAIITTWVLATRKETHRLVEGISDVEMLDTLKMGIIALVVLPLLPDRTLDPLEVLNPRSIWLMVVLVSLIGYAGYVMIKILGANRGLVLTGFLGGLVSSTAVASTMAAEVRACPESLSPAVMATAVASCTMFPRILIIILVVNRSLIFSLALPMMAMAVIGLILAYLFTRHGGQVKAQVQHQDPFRLMPALKFGAFVVFILFASKLASMYFGQAGVYAASIFAGLADVDAITLSMATLAKSVLTPQTAVNAIVLASITNTLVKLAISYILGTSEFGRRIALIFLPMTAVGLVLSFLV